METRGLWWNIHEYSYHKEIFYSLFLISLIFFFYGFYLKIKIWSKGRPENNHIDFKQHLITMLSGTFLHKGWGKNKLAIFAHILVFYGFFVLWIGTDILTVQDQLPEYFFHSNFYKAYSLTMDTFGILMLIGLGVFTYIRYIKKPSRLDNLQNDWFQLIFFAILVVVGFLIEGIRQSATSQIEPYAPVGALVAYCVQNLSYETQKQTHLLLWWFHSLQTFLFVALIPYTKFSHILISPANLFFSNTIKKGALSMPFNLAHILSMEHPPDDFAQTINKVEDFTWKDLMDLDACTSCGRCHEVCPATNSEKPLSPKWFILDLRQAMYNKASYPHKYKGKARDRKQEEGNNLTDLITHETLWSCTTCNACVESCPVGINQLTKIVDLRRTLIHNNKAPTNLLNTLRNIRSRSNPWGQPVEDREKWMEGLEVPLVSYTQDFEYLYWIGCAASYDSRNQNVAKTMIKLLKKADVKFAVLGKKEKCTGDTARRAGDEGLFQELATKNIETFKATKAKKIITHCPHCYNTFKNEYPELGLKEVVVYHHTEILWQLIKEGKLTMTKEVNEQITYHDSCYLGRHNDQYEAPRNILNKIPGIKYIEMKNSRQAGTCCGGGGASLWFESPGKQINVMRLNEIKESGAKTAASACPFCTIMLETARTLDKSESAPKIQDISEIVASSVL